MIPIALRTNHYDVKQAARGTARRTAGFPAASASTCRDCNPRRSTNRGAA